MFALAGCSKILSSVARWSLVTGTLTAAGWPSRARPLLHPPEALVVVGELLHVRERDLAGEDRVVVGHVRLQVVGAVLELDVHAGTELLEIESAPVDPDRVADAAGLLACCSPLLSHSLPPFAADYHVISAGAERATPERLGFRALYLSVFR